MLDVLGSNVLGSTVRRCGQSKGRTRVGVGLLHALWHVGECRSQRARVSAAVVARPIAVFLGMGFSWSIRIVADYGT